MDNINNDLKNYLKELGLTTFVENYRQFAEDATQSNLSYERFLLGLVEQEIAFREQNRRVEIAPPSEPKGSANFDPTALPGQWHLIPGTALNDEKDQSS